MLQSFFYIVTVFFSTYTSKIFLPKQFFLKLLLSELSYFDCVFNMKSKHLNYINDPITKTIFNSTKSKERFSKRTNSDNGYFKKFIPLFQSADQYPADKWIFQNKDTSLICRMTFEQTIKTPE